LTQINGRLASADKDKPLFNCGLPEHTTAAANYTNTFATPNLTGNDVNPDLFMQILRYDNPDANIGSTTPQYNGNIAQIEWQVGGREAQAYTLHVKVM
jgi:hypothetical protein